jgi:hypothetical protein
MPFNEFFKFYGASSINYLRPTYHYETQMIQKVKSFAIHFENSFNEGYISVSQRDHRQDGLEEGTPYIYTNIISLVCKGDKVIRKIQ